MHIIVYLDIVFHYELTLSDRSPWIFIQCMSHSGGECCSMIAAILRIADLKKRHIAGWLQQYRDMITTMWSHCMNVDPVRSSQVFLSSRQNYLSTVSLMNPDYNRVHIVFNSCLRTYLRRYMAKCKLREVFVSIFTQLSHFHSCVYVSISAQLSHVFSESQKNEKTERSLCNIQKAKWRRQPCTRAAPPACIEAEEEDDVEIGGGAPLGVQRRKHDSGIPCLVHFDHFGQHQMQPG